MGNEQELIFSVRQVFQDRLGKDWKYRIPDYQRGYKWTEKNVKALLKDIMDFRQVNDDQFYCLQNITVAPADGHYYNVIDGQQRLTTLFILLCYLGEGSTVDGKLIYAVRESTEEYLQSDIRSRKCWSTEYQHTPQHQDEYYILKAAETIRTWFEDERTLEEVNSLQKEFSEKLLDNTKLIINEVEGNEHQTFSNLNGKNIPLDAADLIRAMLITDAVKEGKEKTDIEPYRARMGAEIDGMDRIWSGEGIQVWFRQLLPVEVERNAKQRRFDISAHPINLLYILFLLSRPESHDSISFEVFESYLKSSKNDTFKAIKKFHNDMMDWFEDINLYHFVGFLMFHYKGNRQVHSFEEISFKNVYQLWVQQSSKKAFLVKIKQIISSLLLSDVLSEEQKEKGEDSAKVLLGKIRFNMEANWYVDPKLPSILILNDIILTENSESLNRIPPSFLRVNDEDREHISCQTPGKKDLGNKERWREDIAQLKKFEVAEDKKEAFQAKLEKMEQMIDKEDEITPEIAQNIIEMLTEFGLNSIGNIVLLNESVNRGYHNSPFVEKRVAILKNYFNIKEKEEKKATASKNKFIRPFTLRTFLRNLSEDNPAEINDAWSLIDIQRSADSIAETIEQFISGGQYNG